MCGEPADRGALRMEGSRLWLARYWDQEALVADELLARSGEPVDDLDLTVLRSGLDRLFLPEDADQRAAAAVCALARVSVLAGGPGTGKTTTVSRLLALLIEQHPDWRSRWPPRPGRRRRGWRRPSAPRRLSCPWRTRSGSAS
jgi:exodeoxyribonuclease V alpha subunit